MFGGEHLSAYMPDGGLEQMMALNTEPAIWKLR